MPDNDLDSKVAQVTFPSPLNSQSTGANRVIPRTVQRAAPKPTQLILMDTPGDEIMSRLYYVSANLRSIFQKGEPAINKTNTEDGKIRFELELDNGQRYLLIFIYAINHVLSSKEVETINTELDTEGFQAATIISFGKISSSAKTMYLRLQERKQIEILVNESIASETNSLISDQQRIALSHLDSAHHTVCILMGKSELYLLVIDKSNQYSKFYILSEDGSCLDSTDSVVAYLRRANPDFSVMIYKGETNFGHEPQTIPFDEIKYLQQCYKEYNVMKYAALANVGLRFSDTSLEALYINASASDTSNNTASRFEQIVGDHLDNYQVTGELKEMLQQQLLTDIKHGDRQETSRALEFCQKYSAVLITGDPGSGKTCFVKSEILSYCKRAISIDNQNDCTAIDWHTQHIPIMVPLSEAAAEDDLNENGLLTIASRLLGRRGLNIGPDDMFKLVTQGRLAFFFDGLDEVVSVEKRAQIVKHINELVADHLQTGNRFIVTSRPAAVQVVDLMPSLHKLELQGLTEAEIRKLAGRLLTLKLSATPNDVLIGTGDLNESDHKIISQLIADCEKNTGVSRMAQNPLLLTLLIMIYANSGAPSAKRHRIYEEAIQTLASVRGREAGHQPISVQDLRERLGAIALSVYNKESGILPTRSEVIEVVREVMKRQLDTVVSVSDANAFIQRVAESTGLIVLETRLGEEDGNTVVTFMHHSFLEYFAAIGLSGELENIDIGNLVNEPRWREILTLLAGIIGERKDVSPIIKRFLESGTTEHDVDAKSLLFSIDCALECEVPSESAQRLLASHIKQCLEIGPARLDLWVRAEIGKRLSQLLSVCGGSEFDGMLAGLIRDGDEAVSAAAIDVAGHTCSNDYKSVQVISAFNQACSRLEVSVLSSICIAASRANILRTDAAKQVITRCLKKSKRNQHAAYQALAQVPSLASNYWDDIIEGIDDNNRQTSQLASIAAMHAGLNLDVISLTAAKKDILVRALDKIAYVSDPHEFHNLTVKRETLDHLLASASLSDRILGIRLLPLAEAEARYIYETLIKLVRDKTPREELVAALIALRWSNSVLALVKLSDLKIVAQWLRDGTSDVRAIAANLLGYFSKDRVAIDSLLDEDFTELDIEDYCNRVLALSRAKTELIRVKDLFFNELNKCLGENKKSPDNQKKIETLLDASRRLGLNATPPLVDKIKKLIDDYKVDLNLRQKALLCLPAIATPSNENVEIVTGFFKNPRAEFEMELVQLPSILAKNCRSSIDSVVACVNALSSLRDILHIQHSKYSKRNITERNEQLVTELRSGINDLSQIIVAFKDFIGDSIESASSTTQQIPF